MDSIAASSSNATVDETVLIQPSPNSGSTGDSNPLEGHPLLNPLIVDKIVEQLNPSFEQLKSLRLVSKIWTEATLHHWRSSCAVLTLIQDPAPTFFSAPKQCKGLPVSQFLAEFQNPQSSFQLAAKPFSKYKFKGLTFDLQVCNKTGGPAQTFWNSVGPLIQSVHFENCIFVRPRSVKSTCPLTQLLVTMIPNVKHLVLNAVVIQIAQYLVKEQEDLPVFIEKPHLSLRTLTVHGDIEMGQTSLKDLFKLAPQLESIEGVDLPTKSMTKLTILKPIYQTRFQAQPGDISPLPLSNLKQLDLINSGYFLENDCQWKYLVPPPPMKNQAVAVTHSQLPLETLALHLDAIPIGGFRVPPGNAEFDKYLLSFSGTLKTLKIFRAPIGPPYARFLSGASSAGEMTLLTELELWGTFALHFGFLKSAPNLKRLRINLTCFEKREQLKGWIKKQNDEDGYFGNFKYQKHKQDMVAKVPTNLKVAGILCTELEDLEIDHEFPEESLRILGKWMPNLKRLKTILNGRTIPIICEVWRDLTELVCLHGSRVDDSCLIRDEEKAGFSGSPPPKLKICDLKDLERLQVDTYCGESELTEDAVYNGLLKMPGLKSVKICVNDRDMSKVAEEALKQGVQFCEVIRNNKLVRSYEFDEDGHEICGCDRCIFRAEAEKGFLENDVQNEGCIFFTSEEDDDLEELSGSENEDVSDDSNGSVERAEF